jgi:Uncharacterized protein conserved in bacteria (DUF2087)
MQTQALIHPDRLAQAAAMVVKERVGLGVLAEAERQLALALVWAALPDAVMNEKAINAELRAVLGDGVAAFLATDHVELRRWLADAGWLQRDSWGREYRRVAFAAFDAERRAWVEPLLALQANAWARGLRAARAAERGLRRARWQAGANNAAQGATA